MTAPSFENLVVDTKKTSVVCRTDTQYIADNTHINCAHPMLRYVC